MSDEKMYSVEEAIEIVKNKVTNRVFHNDYFNIYCNRDIDITSLMSWIMPKFLKLAKEMKIELKKMIEITIVDKQEDLTIFNKDFYWCTGLSTMNEIFIIHPKDYKKGVLYPNVLFHEIVHCLIYQLFGHDRNKLQYEEGFAVLFSTPINAWKKELMKEENEHYLYEYEHLKEIYSNSGIDGVIAEMSKNMTLNEEYSILTESSYRKYPIYVYALQGNSLMSAMIRKVTKSKYTHSCLSLDLTMENLFSFNMRGDGGFRIESLSMFRKELDTDDFMFKINVCFISEDRFRQLKSRIDFYKKHSKDTKYNFLRLFQIMFNKVGIKNNMNMICSEFVANILEYCGIHITTKDSTTVTPEDIASCSDNNDNIYTLYEGSYKNFNINKLRGQLSSISRHSELIASESKNL